MADNVTKRTVNVTENPRIVGGVAPIEEWEIYNFTVDAHPIHLHLVEFQVVSRAAIPGMALISGERPAVGERFQGHRDRLPGRDHDRAGEVRYPGPVRLALPHRRA